MTTKPMRGVITDKQVNEMRERNEKRQQEAIKLMGRGYVLHPNATPRKPY